MFILQPLSRIHGVCFLADLKMQRSAGAAVAYGAQQRSVLDILIHGYLDIVQMRIDGEIARPVTSNLRAEGDKDEEPRQRNEIERAAGLRVANRQAADQQQHRVEGTIDQARRAARGTSGCAAAD